MAAPGAAAAFRSSQKTMTDDRSSYLDDALLGHSSRSPMTRSRSGGNSAARRGFRPLMWLRSTIFGAGDGMTLVPASTSPPLVVESRGQALREAHRSLRGLIKQYPGLRQAMPHLAHIERALRRQGSRALDRVPVSVLQRGLEQLDRLQSEQPRDALRTLRYRLVEAIAMRHAERRAGHGDSGPDSVGGASPRTRPARRTPDGVEVMEVPQSEFDEVERSWTGTLPRPPRGWSDSSHH